jgi:hypothetical protein
MQSSSVLHLVSNSLTHADNTAESFKVSYNVPFDLTGKKISLTNATLTKAQPNVLEEKITLNKVVAAEVVGVLDHRNFAILKGESATATRPDWETFVQRFNGYLKNESGEKLVKLTTRYSPMAKQVNMVIRNRTDLPVKILYMSDSPHAAWKILPFRRGTDFSDVTETKVREARYTKEITLHTLTLKAKTATPIEFTTSHMPSESTNSYADFLSDHRLLIGHSLTITQDRIETKVIQPGPGNFDSIQSLLDNVNEKLGTDAKFTLSQGKVKLLFSTTAPTCEMNLGGLELHFGFDNPLISYTRGGKREFTAERPFDLTRGTQLYFIYCSLGKPVPVNENYFQLLATLDATRGGYGEQISHHVIRPLAVDCVEGIQQMVEVSISDNMGNRKGLLMGTTKLTLASGGLLPVYVGRRQRGGGILSSIARFFIPTAKKMLTETVKAAPGVVDAIVNKRQSAGAAIVSGLKKAGGNTARSTLERLTAQQPTAPKRRAPPNRNQANKKRRVAQPKDIFD